MRVVINIPSLPCIIFDIVETKINVGRMTKGSGIFVCLYTEINEADLFFFNYLFILVSSWYLGYKLNKLI